MINKLFDLLIKPVSAAPNVSLPAGSGNVNVGSNSDVVGTIALPAGIPSEIAKTGDFITAIVRFIIIIGGLFTLWQFLSGGLTYITSNGDKAKISEASNKITMSLTGLVIMAASFVIIAIVSKLLFNDFTAILIPKFTSVTP